VGALGADDAVGRVADDDHRRHGVSRQRLQRLWRRQCARSCLLPDGRARRLGLSTAQPRRRDRAMKTAGGWLLRGGALGLLAFAIFGPVASLGLWAVAIQWYFPHKLPVPWGFRYWAEVFKPTSDAFLSLGTSVVIAAFTVVVCLALAVPTGY